jgi:tRNA(Ile)-lysidine synthase
LARRKDLQTYLGVIGQGWREDESNRDLRHARNRMRHEILPRLQGLNPALREVLAETADIARAEEDYWENESHRLLVSAWKPSAKTLGGAMKVSTLTDLPLALQRRLVRTAAESLGLRLEFRHVEEILGLTSKQSKSAVLPNGWTVSLRGGELRFAIEATSRTSPDYEFRLSLPGATEVPQLGSRFEAILVSANAPEVYNREHLLDRFRLSSELCVRNWRPGDRFWPAHTKTPKKIKELLQELHLRGSDRRLWPVVVSGTDVIWLRGFPVPIQFRPQVGALEAVLIRETGLQSGE